MAVLWISILIFNLAAFFLPKQHVTRDELYVTVFVAFFLELYFDLFADLNYDLYGYFNKGFDFKGLIPVLGLIPSCSIIYMKLYPFGKPFFKHLFFYIIAVSCSIGYEKISLMAGYLYYNGWKLWWSIPVYVFIIFLLSVNIRIYQRFMKSSS